MNTPTIYTATPADLSPPVQSESFCVDVVLAADYRELEEKYQQLAAESVALAAENKKAVDAVTVFSNVTHDITEIICDEIGLDRVAEIVAAYNDLGNMPATDRIVAGIKADGVEEFAKFMLRDACGDKESQRVIGEVLDASETFAKQLREGGNGE